MNRDDFQQAKLFIFKDIEREIALGKVRDEHHDRLRAAGVPLGGGNFLAALGLLCYTEFLGGLKYPSAGGSRATFDAMFADLGPPAYADFLKTHDVYKIFRCGLAHEYYVKKSCTIAMVGTDMPVGIGVTRSGRYWFVVERYCLDLKKAFDDVEKELFP